MPAIPVLFLKSKVRAHQRRNRDGSVAFVREYENSVRPQQRLVLPRRIAFDTRTGDLFATPAPDAQPSPAGGRPLASGEPADKTRPAAAGIDLPQTREFKSGKWTYRIAVDRYLQIPKENLAPEYQANYDNDLVWRAERRDDTKPYDVFRRIGGDDVPLAIAKKAHRFFLNVKDAHEGGDLAQLNLETKKA